MAWFDRESQNKSRKEDLVDIDATIDGYRRANWDPYSLLQDVREAGLEASSTGRHLWVTSEALQMGAASTWLASVRQSIAHSLVDGNEEKGKLPKDVATMAHSNYGNAHSWLEKRKEARSNPAFALANPNALDINLSWPQPDTQNISPEMLASTYRLTGDLVSTSLPIVLQVLDLSIPFPQEYKAYDTELMQKLQKIQESLQHLNMNWSEALDPNIQPGRELYKESVAIIEAIVQFGVDALVPVVGNNFYKLPPYKPKKEVRENAFNPALTRPLRPAVEHPTTPAFDPAVLQDRLKPPVITPSHSAPVEEKNAFNPSAYQERYANKPEVEGFNPAEYLRRYLGAHATKSENAFDPTAHLRARQVEAAAPKPAPEAFDASKYRPR